MSAVLDDTSVWVGHLRRANPELGSLLENDRVLCHPLIEAKRLYDTGYGAVDLALLASVLLTSNARLWTTDGNLAALAARLGVAFEASGQ